MKSPVVRPVRVAVIQDAPVLFEVVMVRGVAPELENIVETTDHAAGSTPFYRQEGG